MTGLIIDKKCLKTSKMSKNVRGVIKHHNCSSHVDERQHDFNKCQLTQDLNTSIYFIFFQQLHLF